MHNVPTGTAGGGSTVPDRFRCVVCGKFFTSIDDWWDDQDRHEREAQEAYERGEDDR